MNESTFVQSISHVVCWRCLRSRQRGGGHVPRALRGRSRAPGIAFATQWAAMWVLVLVASTSERRASEAGARADGGLGASLFALCRGEQGDRRLVLQGGGAAERVHFPSFIGGPLLCTKVDSFIL